MINPFIFSSQDLVLLNSVFVMLSDDQWHMALRPLSYNNFLPGFERFKKMFIE